MARTAGSETIKHFNSNALSAHSKKKNGDSVQPKRRLIIPGHLVPQIGTCRTDAPTTSWVAEQIAETITVSLNMFGETCYVSDDFLSGMPMDGSIHIRAHHVAYRQSEEFHNYDLANFVRH